MSATATAQLSDEEPPWDDSPASTSIATSSAGGSPRPQSTAANAVLPDEHTSLLGSSAMKRSFSSPSPLFKPQSVHSASRASFPRPEWRQYGATGRMSGARTPVGSNPAQVPAWGAKVVAAMQSSWHGGLQNSMEQSTLSKYSAFWDERVWYDQYTSTDWVHDSIADNFRVKDLRARKGLGGRLALLFDGAQGWILVAIVGVLTAFIAYFVDLSESAIFDLKEGYCVSGWYKSKDHCCLNTNDCPLWRTWGDVLQLSGLERQTIDLVIYVASVVTFAITSCLLTLTTKTVVPSNVTLPTTDENLGADVRSIAHDGKGGYKTSRYASPGHTTAGATPPMTYYPAAGSGVAEVKVILSGFVFHGYIGAKTLVVKTLALVLSVASGMSLGKEGPFVHIATCVGNVTCRLFAKYRNNDGKRREVLSAAAASGVAVAFGAPLAGTLFSLEEVSYYFPPKTLFRTFFCCIAAAMSLKFLDPYGTGKIVIFQVQYVSSWYFFEICGFAVLGCLGGLLGALFIKASRLWARSFRRISIIKRMPIVEVAIVAFISGIVQFWNKHTKQPVAQLLSDLASPCKPTTTTPSHLCPTNADEVYETAVTLAYAFVIKSFLTVITFGIKVPAGIYVPSMVVGGIMGRLFGHGIQLLTMQYPNAAPFAECSLQGGSEACVTPGVYALIAAGATMCGVTRLSVTLVVILFELTGSLDHVLPFSLAVLISKWVADAIEPLSIYDLLTELNQYPYLDNKTRPVFTSQLGDITPRSRGKRRIDVTHSSKMPVGKLSKKLAYLQAAGEIDGGLPIVRRGVLVGLLPAPDLQFALDKLREDLGHRRPSIATSDTASDRASVTDFFVNHADIPCLMVADHGHEYSELDPDEEDGDGAVGVFDLTPYVDPAPLSLDVNSPMDLVYQAFMKLGLRYVCVTREGLYAGMVHKKAFVKYIRDLEAGKEI